MLNFHRWSKSVAVAVLCGCLNGWAKPNQVTLTVAGMT